MMEFQPETKAKIKLEIIWWFFTMLVAYIVLLPIMRQVQAYPFFALNTFLIIVGITFARYIFLLKHSWLAYNKWGKRIIIGCSVFFIFWLVLNLGDFNSFMKEGGLHGMLDHMHVRDQVSTIKYMKNEMVFFGVAAIIGAIVLPIRLVISLWRVRNQTGRV